MEWALVSVLAECSRPGALASLRLDCPEVEPVIEPRKLRSMTGCTADVHWCLQSVAPDSLSVSEIRARVDLRWSARRVNAVLQRMVRRREAKVTEWGSPKRYTWGAGASR